MKKIFILIFLISVLVVGCGSETKQNETGTSSTADREKNSTALSYDDIIELPVHYHHVDNQYQESLSELENRYAYVNFKQFCPIIVKVKETHNYIDWTNDPEFHMYPSVYGHTKYVLEVVDIAEGYECELKKGDVINSLSEYYIKSKDSVMVDFISNKTGKQITDMDDIKKLESFSFEYFVTDEKCTQYIVDDVYPLEIGMEYSCIYAVDSNRNDSIVMNYYYPINNGEEFRKTLKEKYKISDAFLKLATETNEVFMK